MPSLGARSLPKSWVRRPFSSHGIIQSGIQVGRCFCGKSTTRHSLPNARRRVYVDGCSCQVHRCGSGARWRRRGYPVFTRSGRRRVQGLPRRQSPGPRRPHGPARQDLPHQRLLDVHAGAQAGRGRPTPQHRDHHQLRARPGSRAKPGNFKATIRHHARFVDPEQCTSCGECEPACPVTVNDQYNEDLGQRKAIYKLYPQAIPNTYVVDKKGYAPCKTACPVETSAQGYVALIAEGRFEDAYRVAAEPNPFPSVCGRICAHPCETACTRGDSRRADLHRQPQALRLRRGRSDRAAREAARHPRREGRHHRRRAQPASPAPATLPSTATPPRSSRRCRSPAACSASASPTTACRTTSCSARSTRIVALGVDLRLNQRAGADFTVDGLLEDGYKAVFLATGLQASAPAPVKGDDLDGCLKAVEFLRELNLGAPMPVGDRVVVIGGGDVAFDAGPRRLAPHLDQRQGARGHHRLPAHARRDAGLDRGDRGGHRRAAPHRVPRRPGRDPRQGRQGERHQAPAHAGSASPTSRAAAVPSRSPTPTSQIACDTVVFAIGQAIVEDFAKDLEA